MPVKADKVVFFTSSILILSVAFFVLGMISTQKQNALFHFANNIAGNIRLVINDLRNNAFREPIHFIQPSQYEGAGVTINNTDDKSLVFLSGFFDDDNALRLIERNGTPVAEWKIRFSELIQNQDELPYVPSSDWNIDLHGAHINPDGSVVFNLEYVTTVKLSRCGDVLWTLPGGHHSVEKSERGGYWIPVRKTIGIEDGNKYPPLTYFPPSFFETGDNFLYQDDRLVRVSEEGKVLQEKSITEIFFENGLETVLTSIGSSYNGKNLKSELVHHNKIAELPAAIADRFPLFEAHDLVLSLRHYNLLMVVDPDDWKIKWHQIGPWVRQHDPEFAADGTIIVFNNNAYRTSLGELDRQLPDVNKDSNILAIDPVTNKVERLYGSEPGQQFLSVLRGKVDVLADTGEKGRFLITEFEGGRVFETGENNQVIWEYINRYDEQSVLEITEARRYAKEYFEVGDWSCPSS